MGPSPHSTTTSLPHSKPMEPLTPKLQLNIITSHFKSSQKRCTTSGATSPSTYGVIRPFTASRRVNGTLVQDTLVKDDGGRTTDDGGCVSDRE